MPSTSPKLSNEENGASAAAAASALSAAACALSTTAGSSVVAVSALTVSSFVRNRMSSMDSPRSSTARPMARIESTPRAATMRRSMRLSAFWTSVVGRTSLNSRNAFLVTMPFACSSSEIPASSTIKRSLPLFWMRGSFTPNSSIRVRMIRSTRSIMSAFASEVMVPSGSSTSRTRCIPPWRSRPSLSQSPVSCLCE